MASLAMVLPQQCLRARRREGREQLYTKGGIHLTGTPDRGVRVCVHRHRQACQGDQGGDGGEGELLVLPQH